MKAKDKMNVVIVIAVLSVFSGCVPNLHSSHRKLSVSQVQSIPNISITKEEVWGFCGHSTIVHDYELKSIKGDKVVIDYSTGLMWHQSGSESNLNYKEATQLLDELNKEGYAGYHDWRLPTLEEAVSLLESIKKNGLYIDAIFNNEQTTMWTGDNYNPAIAWRVAFDGGSVSWGNYGNYGSNYVRAIRSIE